MRILLDAKDFQSLTRGDIIEKGSVKIALSDIGYDVMENIIKENKSKSICSVLISKKNERHGV